MSDDHVYLAICGQCHKVLKVDAPFEVDRPLCVDCWIKILEFDDEAGYWQLPPEDSSADEVTS